MAGSDFSPLDEVLKSAEPLKKGERVKLEFTSNPSKWIRATQIYVIEGRLDKNKDITVISADYWGEDTISFDVEVTNPGALITEQLIIGFIMSANPLGFYLVHKPGVEKAAVKVVETVQDFVEAAKKVASWTPLAVAAIAVVAVLFLWKK